MKLTLFAAAFGMSMAAIGTALAIGMLSSKAAEGIARQPEAAGPIRTAMIIAIAFIEAIALYTFVICVLVWTKG